jgi:hypothetical protein
MRALTALPCHVASLTKPAVCLVYCCPNLGTFGSEYATENATQSKLSNRSDGRTWRAYASAEVRWNLVSGTVGVRS